MYIWKLSAYWNILFYFTFKLPCLSAYYVSGTLLNVLHIYSFIFTELKKKKIQNLFLTIIDYEDNVE